MIGVLEGHATAFPGAGLVWQLPQFLNGQVVAAGAEGGPRLVGRVVEGHQP